MGKMYYTEDEALDKLGVSLDELTNQVRQRKLRLFKDGERNMYMASEVDALAGPDTEEEVELSPVEDTQQGMDVSLADETKSPGKEDTVITAEGISIFDDEDLEVEPADPLAKTQISPSVEDQVALEGAGSGSGLLDLTRESDDTSLGEVIDHIDLEDSGEQQAPATQMGTYDEPMTIPEAVSVAAAAPVPEIREAIDPSAGLYGGFLVGSAVVAMLLGALTLAAGADVMPGYLVELKRSILIVIIASVVVVGLFGVIGLMLGRSVFTRQKAMQGPAAGVRE